MAIDAYLQIDGIKDESADSAYLGWSFGEQFGGVHINRPLTGIAIGRGVEDQHA